MYGYGGPSVPPKIAQQKRRKPTNVQRGQLLPQKYRIVIDCTNIVDPNSLKTNIKCVQDCKHLIVSSNLKQGRQQFKRSYTLPVECDVKKMTKFVTPQRQLVIEFNYMDVPLSLAIAPEHEICTTAEHGKCVHVKVPIADFVEPAKVKVHVKSRDLFVHFEERIVPCGDFCSRVIYHTRVQLPQNVNLNAITAKSDKHKLTILAPIGVKKGQQQQISKELHDIAVKRKLRHRKARAVSVGAEQKQPVVADKTKKKQQVQPSIKPSISGEKQKRTPLDTSLPTVKPTTPIGGQESTISKKKQKKQTSLLDKPEQKPSILKPEGKKTTPSISEQKPSLEEKKPAQQLPVVSSEEKKKKKKKSKKSTTTTTNMPTSNDKSTTTPTSITTPTDVSPTSISQQEPRKEPSPVDVGPSRDIGEDRGRQDVKERSPVRTTEKGTDILKNIFDLGGGSSQPSTTSTTQPSASSSERVPESSGQRVPESGGPIQL